MSVFGSTIGEAEVDVRMYATHMETVEGIYTVKKGESTVGRLLLVITPVKVV